ncbi:superoxide dismutase [Geminicoccus roseus]|uniref:superoxide dismutase n=1 Tax=Geminicoccus roseus TaxID=404900 RepID=UPI0004168872|nr:superoxide dismutase [Geminicoccus roseus]
MSILSRRHALAGLAGAGFVGSLALWARPVLAQASGGPFELPPLPYAFDKNAPHIDTQTMGLHHDKHHASYVEKLNAAVSGHGELADKPLPEILANLGSVPENIRTAVRNNGGGHANHSMFWQVMGGSGGAPSGELAEAVDRDLGGVEQMKSDFNKAGGGVFGSGWVFVTVTQDGTLALTTRPNQDTPLMDGHQVLFGNDVWEHAYYLNYQNRRPAYLEAWWNVVNWDAIAQRYADAKAGTLTL